MKVKFKKLLLLLLVSPLFLSTAFALEEDYNSSGTGYCPTITKTVVRGSVGNDVVELQKFLADYYDLGSGGPGTGFFGRVTQGYVIKFQAEYGLPAYGTVGPLTRAKIASVCNLANFPNINSTVNTSTNTNATTVKPATTTNTNTNTTTTTTTTAACKDGASQIYAAQQEVGKLKNSYDSQRKNTSDMRKQAVIQTAYKDFWAANYTNYTALCYTLGTNGYPQCPAMAVFAQPSRKTVDPMPVELSAAPGVYDATGLCDGAKGQLTNLIAQRDSYRANAIKYFNDYYEYNWTYVYDMARAEFLKNETYAKIVQALAAAGVTYLPFPQFTPPAQPEIY